LKAWLNDTRKFNFIRYYEDLWNFYLIRYDIYLELQGKNICLKRKYNQVLKNLIFIKIENFIVAFHFNLYKNTEMIKILKNIIFTIVKNSYIEWNKE
jgi:hypothetical protein